MGSNTERNQWTNLQSRNKRLSKNIKGDNLCYCKVGRAIIIWGEIDLCSISKNGYFDMAPKIISNIGDTNNIFAECIQKFVHGFVNTSLKRKNCLHILKALHNSSL